MVVLRCTRKLLKRVGGESDVDEPESTTQLGDWYANVISLPFRGKSVIIFTNAESLLTVTVPGRGSKKAISEFHERAAKLLGRLNLPQDKVEREIEAMQEFVITRTASRSVLGSMNEIGHFIKSMVSNLPSADEIHWGYIEDRLSMFVHLTLEELYPIERAQKLFGTDSTQHR